MAVGNVEIAVGQVWRCRDGHTTGVLEKSGDTARPFWCNKRHMWWDEVGRAIPNSASALDLVELVRDEHGFTLWAGGECPVDQHAMVSYKLSGSSVSYGPLTANRLVWDRSGLDDIVAYKVVELAQQPTPSTPDSASLAEEMVIALGWTFDGTTWVEHPKVSLPEWDGVARIEMHEPAVSAPALLTAAAKHMSDRAATYDKPEGERSMAQTVAIFKAYHGIDLTEAQGWHFMQVLKDVRLFTREAYHADSAEDCIAYAALKAEAMAQEGGA